ncbi:MAG: type I 3-dehydroquinate dehydratase [Candidatus Cloacimonetes bacterium]|nr:type I 3-dehydroquinate dehydratase [Candidatus Cloacimonadota bacterium]
MIILSIPINTIDQKIPKLKSAQKRELRLDYLENPLGFDFRQITSNDIITIRDMKEGGKYPVAFDEKVEYYLQAIKHKNCLVDLEISNYNNKIPAENLILSYHDFSVDYDIIKIENIINQTNQLAAKYIKIAVNISKYSQFTQLSDVIKKSNKPVILVGMGKLGKLSRLLYAHLGSVATYIGFENNKTARGQLSVSEAEIFNLHNVKAKTKIGGLIGGNHVYHSIGIPFYNSTFVKKQIDAYYLPFEVEDFDDFWNWQTTCKFNFYGFSITMPHKTKLASKLGINSLLLARNLYIPNKKTTFNTDAIAFGKSVELLRILESDNILVVGTGSTAETALFALQSFPQLTIYGRNVNAGNRLAEKYKRDFIPFGKNNLSYDLIINCTSLGMKGEDFAKITSLAINSKVIDLPYTNNSTSLIDFCKKMGYPFIDGKMFWHLQAKKQLDEFLAEITE